MRISWLEPDDLAAGGIPLGVKDLQSLKNQNIQVIVTLTEHPLTAQKEITSAILDEFGIISYHAPIVDQTPPDKAQAIETARYINQRRAEGKPVYIHCHAGVGRTGTMLHTLFLVEGMRMFEAQARVRQGKPSSQFLMLSDTQQAFLESLAADLGSD